MRHLQSDRRKFGRIWQRFWFARCLGSRRLQSKQICPGHAPALVGIGIFSGFRMKEHDA
jgi:hypothetical protein